MQRAKIVVFKDGTHEIVKKDRVKDLQSSSEYLCTISLAGCMDDARKLYPIPATGLPQPLPKINWEEYEDDNFGWQ